MEKSQSRSVTKPVPLLNDEPYNVDLSVGRRSPPAKKQEPVPDKPSREDISRCINIWASMYLAGDDKLDKRDLCLPSRPWLGRNPSSLKRFE